MPWKLKCQDCKKRHVGHLWASWAGHGDISEVSSLHTSLGNSPEITRVRILVVSSSWARGQLPPGCSCWEELREKPEAVQLTLELLKCDRVIMRAVLTCQWPRHCDQWQSQHLVMDNNNSLARTRTPSGSSCRRHVRKSESEGSREKEIQIKVTQHLTTSDDSC